MSLPCPSREDAMQFANDCRTKKSNPHTIIAPSKSQIFLELSHLALERVNYIVVSSSIESHFLLFFLIKKDASPLHKRKGSTNQQSQKPTGLKSQQIWLSGKQSKRDKFTYMRASSIQSCKWGSTACKCALHAHFSFVLHHLQLWIEDALRML